MIAPQVTQLTRRLKDAGYHITIETAATVWRDVVCDLASISPKLGNSTPWERDGGRCTFKNEAGKRCSARTMIEFEMRSPDHRIFVLVGRNTFSAAQNFINRVERWTGATFVGEPSSSSPNFVGEENEIVLPYSRVRGSISNLYWQDSDPWDDRPWIAPDLPVVLTAQEYFQGVDPALDRVLDQL